MLGSMLGEALSRRPRALALALFLLTALALLPASRLRPTADLQSLLPEDSEAAQAYRSFLRLFGGSEKVFILVRSRDPAQPVPEELLLEAAWALEDELEGSAEVASVRSGLESEDEAFFLRHVATRALLLLPEEHWQEVVEERLRPETIRQRVTLLKRQLLLPSSLALRPLLVRDPLGFLDELPLLGASPTALPLEPLTSTFWSADERASLLLLSPASSEIDPAAGRRLIDTLETGYRAVRQRLASEHGDAPGDNLDFVAVGGPLYAVHDESILRRDLEATIATTAVGCTLVLLLAFGGPRIPFLTLLSVLVGLVWLAGWLGLFTTTVASLTLGFAAVLVGLGIDYGIHAGARFHENRLSGLSAVASWQRTVVQAGPAIRTSAATTFAAFLVLVAADLRPLRQLGLVVALGILAILLATFSVCPALLCAFPGVRVQRREGRFFRALEQFAHWGPGLAERRSGAVLTLATLLSLVAIGGLSRLELHTDLESLRPDDHPMLEAEAAVSRAFGVGVDTATVLVTGDTLDQALDRAGAVSALLRQSLPSGASLFSASDWIAGADRSRRRLEQLETLPLGEAVTTLRSALSEVGLRVAAFDPGLRALEVMAEGRDPAPPRLDQLPAWLDETLRVAPPRDDARASGGPTWLALQLRLPEGSWPLGPPEPLSRALEEVAPQTLLATTGAVARDLRRLAGRDLERLAVLGLVVILVVVLVAFRGHLVAIVVALTPVFLGTLWTLGLWGYLEGSLDIISLCLIPVLLGIGIDDGLHAVHGARPDEEGLVGRLAHSVRASGRAMTLTTLTTAVGFGSLGLSSLPGLRRGGFTLCVGVVLCLIVTLAVLPALKRLSGSTDSRNWEHDG